MKKLEGKVAIITGCSQGLGKYIALRFAEEGAKVAICARTADKLEKTAEMCRQAGAEVFSKAIDLCSYEDIKGFVDDVVERFGTIDILANNAISIKPPHPFLDHTEEYLDSVMKGGFYATWRLMKLCFPYLKDKKSSIINFGSGVGIRGMEGYAAYASCKEAIRGLSRVAAREWGPLGIRVNVLCPAAITDHVKDTLDELDETTRKYVIASLSNNSLKRPGDPYEDISPVAVFLASDESQWITGQSLSVDGGVNIHS
ncbi:MAG: SDR family oxidoreductase [Lachnospiraceae bacterium]|nr:SDR family oxidoreductase [Lachnospiraceae bacterium]